MARFGTHTRLAALLAALAAAPLHAAQPTQPDELSLAFATCAGRLGAARMHNWSSPGQRVDTTAAHAAFNDILDAVGPDAADRSPMAVTLRAVRSRARIQTDKLLSAALHAPDPRRRRIAAATLLRHLRTCETLLP